MRCQAQSNATSFNVRDAHAACCQDWLLQCAANAPGVSPSRAPWGRSLLYSSHQFVIMRRASWTEVHSQRLRQPSRKTPFKLSLCPFCHGLPGAMKWVSTRCPRSQVVTRWAINAGPLSLLTYPGAPRCTHNRCHTWTTATAVLERAQWMVKPSRVYASRTVRHFSRRPSVVSSWTKS